ncbi:MAG TPA: PQQ-binding-like beta-propeller repeat protein [Gemmataceae bacterium]|nr:PQQ-binding-like beta-propeller repeat protein [Gemmataceae bacterium]
MSTSRRACFGLSAVLLLLAAGGADWPQFLGPTRNGVSPETGLLKTWPEKGPPVVWQREVGEGFSGPVVAGGRLVLFHRVGDEEVVECLDAATGKAHWKAATATAYVDSYGKGNGPRSTPLIAGGKVYTLGPDGLLQCLNLADGKPVWRRELHKDYEVRKGFFGVATSPLLEGKLLLVNVGGRGGAGIVAFDKDSGKEVWKATDHDASYASPVAATIGVRHVLFFTREGVVSLDPANGAVRFSKRWRARIDASVNAAAPLVVGDLVFVTASYRTGALLLRVKKDGAEEVWKGDDVLSSHFTTPVYHAGHLYGFDGRQEAGTRLRCVDFKTGKVAWTKEGFPCGPIIVADGNLIILSEDGDLVLVEATSAAYREKARAKVLGSPCRAPLALADGRLYGHDGRKLVCWKLKE